MFDKRKGSVSDLNHNGSGVLPAQKTEEFGADISLRGKAFEIGRRVIETSGITIVGLSLGNSYYNERNIENLLAYLGRHASRIEIFIPEVPAHHTYRALGYDDCDSDRKCRLRSNGLRNRCRSILSRSADLGKITNELDWEKSVSIHPEYQKRLREIELLYEYNSDFRRDVRENTAAVLSHKHSQGVVNEGSIDIGAKFLLEEIAFLLASPKIFDSKNIAYVYHKDWEIFGRLIEGCYGNGFADSPIGFIVVNRLNKSCLSDNRE